MKLVWFLCLFFGATSADFFGLNFQPSDFFGIPVATEGIYDEFKRQWMQQWNSVTFAAIYGKDALKKVITYNPFYGVSKNDVKFYLYTKRNPTEPVRIWDDPAMLARTYFDVTAPVKILCHGFLGSYKTGSVSIIGPAYLKYMDNVNVISIDWSNLAGAFKLFPSLKDLVNDLYFPPAKYTQSVGRLTAEMIDFLIWQGVPLKNFHLIGHSLGAHVMGAAGRSIKVGMVPRITALDAASPCFEVNVLSACIGQYNPIKSTDAEFVDAIHTDTPFFGYERPIGQVDFYPNGGISQPGCERNWPIVGKLLESTCSHLRAPDLYAQSIKPSSRLIGQQCDNWTEYMMRNCGLPEFARMGEYCARTARGKYFLSTYNKTIFDMLDPIVGIQEILNQN